MALFNSTTYTLKRNLGIQRGQTEPGSVAFYDIWPGNGAGLSFQPGTHKAPGAETRTGRGAHCFHPLSSWIALTASLPNGRTEGWTLAIAMLDRLVTRSVLQSPKWQSIGTS